MKWMFTWKNSSKINLQAYAKIYAYWPWIQSTGPARLSIFWGGGVCFSNPTSPPRSAIGSVPCVPSYTLSSLAFNGVTHGMSFKHTSPPLCYPLYMQVQPGAWSKPIIWETWVQVLVAIISIIHWHFVQQYNWTIWCRNTCWSIFFV